MESDVRLRGFTAGQGRPVLVVHGGPGQPYAAPWAGLAPPTEGYQFVYYDQRGSGRSTRPIGRFETHNYLANRRALDQGLGLGAQIADIERLRRRLGQALPNAQFQSLAGAGHFPFETQPEAFAAAVEGFLSTVP